MHNYNVYAYSNWTLTIQGKNVLHTSYVNCCLCIQFYLTTPLLLRHPHELPEFPMPDSQQSIAGRSNKVLQDHVLLKAWRQQTQTTAQSQADHHPTDTVCMEAATLISPASRSGALPHCNNSEIQNWLQSRLKCTVTGTEESESALYHPEVVTAYLQSEINSSRVIGPLLKHTILHAHISSLVLYPNPINQASGDS